MEVQQDTEKNQVLLWSVLHVKMRFELLLSGLVSDWFVCWNESGSQWPHTAGLASEEAKEFDLHHGSLPARASLRFASYFNFKRLLPHWFDVKTDKIVEQQYSTIRPFGLLEGSRVFVSDVASIPGVTVRKERKYPGIKQERNFL
eukprot:TRINITY_DN10595_c6_g2_i2.p1 TRINITY_DN10595_c6_g2~~TRINITY_DN10595_c6_g2_i2.p1  ORF type:complete len:145 (+),score=10.45 TRINITY_DN10595_c6_g2_i2:312-746(+)